MGTFTSRRSTVVSPKSPNCRYIPTIPFVYGPAFALRNQSFEKFEKKACSFKGENAN